MTAERLSVITRKGQVTVPAEIRRALGLQEGDKVAFVLEAGQARLIRAGSVAARTAGMLAGDQAAGSLPEEKAAAEEAMAEGAEPGRR